MSQPLQIDILSVHISSQLRPEDQSLSLGMNSMNDSQLESKIKNLKLKLEKKDQLIKFLEKKCGNQIIKSSKKFQQKIKSLQTQNANLKNTLELFTLHNDKLQKNILHNKPSEQNSNLETSASNIGIQEETFRENKTKLFYQFKQDLINLSDEQLKQIILIQSFELKKIWKENQINGFLMVKSKTKQKKHGFHAKKNSLVLSLSDSSNRDSNQNLNKLNLHSLALKDTTNLSLNIGSPRQFNKKTSQGLSYRAVPEQIQVETQTQTEEIKTKQEQIQTCNASLTEISCQTEVSMNKIQQMADKIQEFSKNEKELKSQISDLKSQNASLKEQVSFFSVKIQQYCHQLQKQDNMGVDNQIIPNNSPDYQTYITLLDNYIQVLQIFDIQPLIEPLERYNQEKTHKRLINEICGMKLQISQVIKQFKKLQRQLHESFMQRNQLLGEVRWQAQRIMVLEHETAQINELLQNSNEQIMNLRNKDLHWRMLRKYEQLQLNLPQTKLKSKYKKPLTERKQESTKSEVKLSTKSQQEISIGQANQEDYNLLENSKIFENTTYQIEMEDVEALYA